MPETSCTPGLIEHEEARLREQLRTLEPTRELADGQMTRLAGGLSNQAWRVEWTGRTWYARLGRAGAERLGVDRHSECRLLAVVAAAGFAPEVLACDPPTGLLVARFIEGRTWQAADAGDGRHLARLGNLLRRLHALPLAAGVASVSYAQQARRLAATLAVPDPLLEALSRRATEEFDRLARRKPVRALCHHDLHHLNVVDDDKRLWLVDWEYGGIGDPLFDVAGFLALHELGPVETDLFLGAYGGLAAADREVLDSAQWAFDYVQWLWYRTCRGTGMRSGDTLGDRETTLASRLLRCNN